MEVTDGVWRELAATRDRGLRNQVIVQCAPLVRRVVGRLAIGLGGGPELDDLISLGTIGLIEAVERFDPDRGIRFEAFAIKRIRGAVLDGLRQLDPAPISWRRKARQLSQCYDSLEKELGREPEEPEVAARLGLELRELRVWLDEVGRIAMVSLEEVLFDDTTRLERLSDDGATDPQAEAQRRERSARLATALERLAVRERQVMALFYGDGLTVTEIARVLGLSPSRISQLHRRSVLRLRGFLSRERAYFKESY